MVAIQMDPDENSQVAEWHAKGKYGFPVLLVPPMKANGTLGQDDYASANYAVWLAPTDLLLDAAHKVVFRHVGGAGSAIEVEIRELLGLPPFEGLEPAISPGRAGSGER
jgi:hypothetical protein